LGFGITGSLPSELTGGVSNPELGIDALGNAIVAWTQGQDGEAKDLWVRHLAESTASWTNKRELADHDRDAGQPSLAMNADGYAMIVWKQDLTHDPDQIFRVAFDPEGDWSTRRRLSGEKNAERCLQPKVSLDDSRNSYAVWEQGTDEVGKVWTNNQANGASWGQSRAVAHPDDAAPDAHSASLAGLSGGDAMAAWIQSADAPSAVWTGVALANGSWREPVQLSPVASDEVLTVKLAGNSSGQVAAVFTTHQKAWASVYVEGEWSEPALLRSASGDNNDAATLVVDELGVVHAAWRETRGADVAIYSARLEKLTGDWSPAVNISGEGESVGWPHMAVDGLGNVQVVWIADAEGVPSVWTARRQATESGWSTAFLLEQSNEPMKGPRVALSGSGAGLVVWWEDTNEPSLGYNLFR
jgi:hypothetical protein